MKAAYRYLFFADDFLRQRNLLKTNIRSLKSFNCSCVIGRKYTDVSIKFIAILKSIQLKELNGNIDYSNRCFIASYKIIPAATETFKLAIAPTIAKCAR